MRIRFSNNFSRTKVAVYFMFVCALSAPTISSAAGNTASEKLATPLPFTFEKIDLKKIQGSKSGAQSEEWIVTTAKRHAKQYIEAPEWVRELENRKVSDYFKAELSPQAEMFALLGVKPKRTEINDKQRKRLLADALKLHEYFESESNADLFKDAAAPLFEDFTPSLQSYILNINEDALASELDGIGAASLADVTMGELVAQRQIDYLYHRPDFLTKLGLYFSGRHLKAASKLVGGAAVVAGIAYAGHVFHFNSIITSFVGGILLGGFSNGPVADIFKASFGWLTRPTTEVIRVQESRITGKWEEGLNNFFDTAKSGEDDEKAAQRNQRPKIANLTEDGMNFAGMSEKDQEDNWTKNMRMWVAVAKRFGQLLRDTHHSGRYLMMISWADEQAAASLIETMAIKLITLGLTAEAVLNPYKTAFLVRGEADKKSQLEHAYDEYQATCKSVWSDLSLSEKDLNGRVETMRAIEKRLSNLGLSARDLEIFSDIEMDRAKAGSTLVTAVALNEMRAFGVAEANRNLETEAREAQRATRFGFNLQAYVDEYLPLVQHQMKLMGFQHSAAPKTERKAIACPTILQKLSKKVRG